MVLAAGSGLLGGGLLAAITVTRASSAKQPLLAALTAAAPLAAPAAVAGLTLGLGGAALGAGALGVAGGVAAFGAGLTWRRIVVAPWRTRRRLERNPSDTGGTRIRITVINLLCRNSEPEAVAERLRHEQVDVVVTLETEPLMLDTLRRRSGWRCLATGTGDRGGMTAIWTRRDDIAAGPALTLANGTMPAAIVPTGSGDLRIIGTHLTAPTRRQQLVRWEDELTTLAERARTETAGRHLVVAGDLNASLAHPALRQLAATLDDAAARTGRPLVRTWPGRSVNTGRGYRIPFFNLDHVLLSPELRVEHLRARRWPGTDHLSLTVDLVAPHRPDTTATAA
jgi:endonuclease/exonuclease/phosphatase (EEP) superfamily protein YafD